MAKLGKSQRDKDVVRVASVAAFNRDGELLFGKRSDSGKWTLPGGHLEPGEDPQKAAIRELREEAALKAQSLRVLGDDVVEGFNGKKVHVYAFAALVDGEPHGDDDPDEECEEWRFVSVKGGLPAHVLENLHAPKNIALKLLGLQTWKDAEPLEKMAYVYNNGTISWHPVDTHHYPMSEGRGWSLKPESVNGYHHHVYEDRTSDLKWEDGRHAKVAHVFSSSPDINDQDAQVMVFHGRHHYEGDDALHIGHSCIQPGMQHRGLGTSFYNAVLNHHGKLASDKELSPASNRVWEKLVQQPGVEGKLGAPKTPEQHTVAIKKNDEHPTPAVDDEIFRLLRHPNPAEAAMALKLEGVTAAHLVAAVKQAKKGMQFAPLVRQAMTHPAVNREVLSHVAADRNLVASHGRGLVAHPLFDGQHSEQLAEHLSDTSKMPPHVSQVLLEKLAQHPQTSAAAIHTVVNGDDIQHYTNSIEVAGKLLQHPNVEPSTLGDFFQKFVKEPHRATWQLSMSKEIQKAFLGDKMPEETLKAMADRANGMGFQSGRDLLAMAYRHPKMPKEMVQKAIDHATRPGPSSNHFTAEQKEAASNAGLDDKQLMQFVSGNTHNTLLDIVAQHPSLKPEHIDEFIRQGPLRSGFQHALQHPAATTDHVERALQVAGLPKQQLDSILQNNPKVSHETRIRMFDGGDSYTRGSVLRSASADKALLHHAIATYDPLRGDHDGIINHKLVDAEHLDQAAASPHDALRREAFAHPDMSFEKLHQHLVQNPNDAFAKDAALSRMAVPGAILEHVLNTTQDPTTRDDYLKKAVKLPNLPSKFLDEVMARPENINDNSSRYYGDPMHVAVLKHPNHTTEHVVQALKSPSEAMVNLAIRSPKATTDMLREVSAREDFTYFGPNMLANPNMPADVMSKLVDGQSRDKFLYEKMLQHPNVDIDVMRRMQAKFNVGEKPRKHEKEFVTELNKRVHREDPDSHHDTQVLARVGKGNTGKLRAIRDLILEKEPEKKQLSQKALPPGDWGVGRLPNGNIGADKLQEHIDTIPGQRYNVGKAVWGRSEDTRYQRHSHDRQNVFQLNLTNEHVQKLKDAGLWGHFQHLHDTIHHEVHPVGPMSMGWIRWTGGDTVKAPTPKDDPKGWASWAKSEVERHQDAIDVAKTKVAPEERGALEDVHQNFLQRLNRLDSGAPSTQQEISKTIAKDPFIDWMKKNVHKKAFDTKALKSGTPGVFVDEVQSDWTLTHVQKAKAQARKKAEADFADLPDAERKAQTDAFVAETATRAQAKWPEEKHRAIMKIAFGDRPPQEVLAEAFLQHLRDKGHHDLPVQWHSAESKHHQLKTLGWLNEGDVPAHMKVGYEDTPKKQGMVPSTYGKLATQQRPRETDKGEDVAKLDGQPTFEGKIRKFQEELGEWLAKMALHPADFSDIHGSEMPFAETLVDHKKMLSAHPSTVEPLKQEYQKHLKDSSELHSPTNRNNDGVTKKLVYEKPHSLGGVMVKPFFEQAPERLRPCYPEPLAGWAEATSQALYHAGGIGDLHQKVHVDLHDMGPHSPNHPAVVVHMEKDHDILDDVSLDASQKHQMAHQAHKIALMDFLSSNADRHSGNLMVNKDRTKLLAIDHAYAFQYQMPEVRAGDRGDDDIHDTFESYYQGRATHQVAETPIGQYESPGDLEDGRRRFAPTFDWWKQNSDNIRAEFHKQLQAINAPTLRDHLRSNFDTRADWLDRIAVHGLENCGTDWAFQRVKQFKAGAAVQARPYSDLSPADRPKAKARRAAQGIK